MASCSCCTRASPGEDLPQSLGYGSGMTCWRRLRDWNAAGVWQKLHHAMLVRLREHDQIDWSRASIDGSSVPNPGGQETGPNPTDRGKLGSKRHIVVDARGIPLVVLVSGANRHDSMMFEKCIDALPAVRGLRGKPRCRPSKLHADKGYDYARCRAYLKKRGIASRIARRGVESSERLGRYRWVVERTHGWFAGFWQAAHPLREAAGHPRSAVETGCSDHLRALRGSVVLAALNQLL